MRPERFLHPAWVRAVALSLFALTLSAYAWWPMIAAYPHTEIGDGQIFLAQLEAMRVSVSRYHELPLWNPFECSGMPLWDNPQALVGAPLTQLAYFVGSTRTLELWVILHAAAGFVSMWLLARHELRLTRAAAFVASTAWAFSGFHQHHYSGGHYAFVAFEFFPLALLLWRRAERDVRCAVGLGALVALMFYEGAVYPLPHLVVLLGAETLTRAWPPARLVRIAGAAAIVGAVAFGLAAARLLPVLDQLRSHPRAMIPDVDAMTWPTFKEIFLARSHGRAVPGQQYVWTEFATYLGPLVVLFALAGIVSAGLDSAWLLALLLLVGVLMLGHLGAYAPWSILNAHVPPFKEMRVPSRFRSSVAMFLAAYAGIGTDRLRAIAARWIPAKDLGTAAGLAVMAFAFIGVGDIVSVGIDVTGPFITGPPETKDITPSTRFYYGGKDIAYYIDAPRQNRARFDCHEEWAFGAGAPLWEGDVPQARVAEGQPAVVEVANRTPNTFSLDVDVKAPARVLLNSAYDAGWKSTVGTVVEQDKELAVDLPPGRYKIKLRYWPRTMTAGIVINLLGILGVAAYLARLRGAWRWRSLKR
jgi:hypothetical protein